MPLLARGPGFGIKKISVLLALVTYFSMMQYSVRSKILSEKWVFLSTFHRCFRRNFNPVYFQMVSGSVGPDSHTQQLVKGPVIRSLFNHKVEQVIHELLGLYLHLVLVDGHCLSSQIALPLTEHLLLDSYLPTNLRWTPFVEGFKKLSKQLILLSVPNCSIVYATCLQKQLPSFSTSCSLDCWQTLHILDLWRIIGQQHRGELELFLPRRSLCYQATFKDLHSPHQLQWWGSHWRMGSSQPTAPQNSQNKGGLAVPDKGDIACDRELLSCRWMWSSTWSRLQGAGHWDCSLKPDTPCDCKEASCSALPSWYVQPASCTFLPSQPCSTDRWCPWKLWRRHLQRQNEMSYEIVNKINLLPVVVCECNRCRCPPRWGWAPWPCWRCCQPLPT